MISDVEEYTMRRRRGDGFRVLVDRLWPRGIKKADAALDLWAKDISPSQDLRIWFAHDPQKYAQFGELYSDELSVNPAEIGRAHV